MLYILSSALKSLKPKISINFSFAFSYISFDSLTNLYISKIRPFILFWKSLENIGTIIWLISSSKYPIWTAPRLNLSIWLNPYLVFKYTAMYSDSISDFGRSIANLQLHVIGLSVDTSATSPIVPTMESNTSPFFKCDLLI